MSPKIRWTLNFLLLSLTFVTPLVALRMGTVGVAQQAGREHRDKLERERRRSSQTAYFVDATNGDDANSGQSSGAPWKTLNKVETSTFPSNATIYLKRGETWDEQLVFPSSDLTIDAYGTGASPLINGAVSISGWTNEGGGIYSKQVTLNSGEALANISENGVMMNFLSWLGDATTTFSGQPSGTYCYNLATNIIYIKPSSNPSLNSYLISRKAFGLSAVNKSNILIRNVDITRFSLNGINFQNCQSCSVYNSTITKGGGVVLSANTSAPPTYIYGGNGIEYDTNSSAGIVDSVTISDIFDSGISPQTFGTGQTVSGIQIQNSRLDKCGFAGIEISVLSNGGTTGSLISNITVSSLTITNSGRGWSGQRYGTEGHGIRVIADTGAGAMTAIVLKTSQISGCTGDGVRLGGDIGEVTLHRLWLTNNNYGIQAAEAGTSTLKLTLTSSLITANNNYGIAYNAPNSAGFKIFQNTFYNNQSIHLAVFGQSGEAQLQNNIFYSSAAMTHVFVNTTLTGPTVNHNCYNDVTNMFGYNGLAYSTVNAFRSALGFETNGVGGSVNLTNPNMGDFTLLSTSDCRNLGSSTVGVTEDYGGRNYGNPPSSGAYEF